jgi:hypothetical protein
MYATRQGEDYVLLAMREERRGGEEGRERGSESSEGLYLQ